MRCTNISKTLVRQDFSGLSILKVFYVGLLVVFYVGLLGLLGVFYVGLLGETRIKTSLSF